jgi:hypothetical protein
MCGKKFEDTMAETAHIRYKFNRFRKLPESQMGTKRKPGPDIAHNQSAENH